MDTPVKSNNKAEGGSSSRSKSKHHHNRHSQQNIQTIPEELLLRQQCEHKSIKSNKTISDQGQITLSPKANHKSIHKNHESAQKKPIKVIQTEPTEQTQRMENNTARPMSMNPHSKHNKNKLQTTPNTKTANGVERPSSEKLPVKQDKSRQIYSSFKPKIVQNRTLYELNSLLSFYINSSDQLSQLLNNSRTQQVEYLIKVYLSDRQAVVEKLNNINFDEVISSHPHSPSSHSEISLVATVADLKAKNESLLNELLKMSNDLHRLRLKGEAVQPESKQKTNKDAAIELRNQQILQLTTLVQKTVDLDDAAQFVQTLSSDLACRERIMDLGTPQNSKVKAQKQSLEAAAASLQRKIVDLERKMFKRQTENIKKAEEYDRCLKIVNQRLTQLNSGQHYIKGLEEALEIILFKQISLPASTGSIALASPSIVEETPKPKVYNYEQEILDLQRAFGIHKIEQYGFSKPIIAKYNLLAGEIDHLKEEIRQHESENISMRLSLTQHLELKSSQHKNQTNSTMVQTDAFKTESDLKLETLSKELAEVYQHLKHQEEDWKMKENLLLLDNLSFKQRITALESAKGVNEELKNQYDKLQTKLGEIQVKNHELTLQHQYIKCKYEEVLCSNQSLLTRTKSLETMLASRDKEIMQLTTRKEETTKDKRDPANMSVSFDVPVEILKSSTELPNESMSIKKISNMITSSRLLIEKMECQNNERDVRQTKQVLTFQQLESKLKTTQVQLVSLSEEAKLKNQEIHKLREELSIKTTSQQQPSGNQAQFKKHTNKLSDQRKDESKVNSPNKTNKGESVKDLQIDELKKGIAQRNKQFKQMEQQRIELSKQNDQLWQQIEKLEKKVGCLRYNQSTQTDWEGVSPPKHSIWGQFSLKDATITIEPTQLTKIMNQQIQNLQKISQVVQNFNQKTPQKYQNFQCQTQISLIDDSKYVLNLKQQAKQKCIYSQNWVQTDILSRSEISKQVQTDKPNDIILQANNDYGSQFMTKVFSQIQKDYISLAEYEKVEREVTRLKGLIQFQQNRPDAQNSPEKNSESMRRLIVQLEETNYQQAVIIGQLEGKLQNVTMEKDAIANHLEEIDSHSHEIKRQLDDFHQDYEAKLIEKSEQIDSLTRSLTELEEKRIEQSENIAELQMIVEQLTERLEAVHQGEVFVPVSKRQVQAKQAESGTREQQLEIQQLKAAFEQSNEQLLVLKEMMAEVHAQIKLKDETYGAIIRKSEQDIMQRDRNNEIYNNRLLNSNGFNSRLSEENKDASLSIKRPDHLIDHRQFNDFEQQFPEEIEDPTINKERSKTSMEYIYSSKKMLSKNELSMPQLRSQLEARDSQIARLRRIIGEYARGAESRMRDSNCIKTGGLILDNEQINTQNSNFFRVGSGEIRGNNNSDIQTELQCIGSHQELQQNLTVQQKRHESPLKMSREIQIYPTSVAVNLKTPVQLEEHAFKLTICEEWNMLLMLDNIILKALVHKLEAHLFEENEKNYGMKSDSVPNLYLYSNSEALQDFSSFRSKQLNRKGSELSDKIVDSSGGQSGHQLKRSNYSESLGVQSRCSHVIRRSLDVSQEPPQKSTSEKNTQQEEPTVPQKLNNLKEVMPYSDQILIENSVEETSKPLKSDESTEVKNQLHLSTIISENESLLSDSHPLSGFGVTPYFQSHEKPNSKMALNGLYAQPIQQVRSETTSEGTFSQTSVRSSKHEQLMRRVKAYKEGKSTYSKPISDEVSNTSIAQTINSEQKPKINIKGPKDSPVSGRKLVVGQDQQDLQGGLHWSINSIKNMQQYSNARLPSQEMLMDFSDFATMEDKGSRSSKKKEVLQSPYSFKQAESYIVEGHGLPSRSPYFPRIENSPSNHIDLMEPHVLEQQLSDTNLLEDNNETEKSEEPSSTKRKVDSIRKVSKDSIIENQRKESTNFQIGDSLNISESQLEYNSGRRSKILQKSKITNGARTPQNEQVLDDLTLSYSLGFAGLNRLAGADQTSLLMPFESSNLQLSESNQLRFDWMRSSNDQVNESENFKK